MYDAEITAKVFLKMLEATRLNGIEIAAEIDNTLPDFDSYYNYTWQLKNINKTLALQCKVGEVLNLIRKGKTDNVNYLGVINKCGANLGEIDCPDISYYNLWNLCFMIDHGAKVSVKIKQIVTKNEQLEGIYVKVSIGILDKEQQNKLVPMNRVAKGIISKAKTLEETDPEHSVTLYRRAMGILKEIDYQCEKHFSTWREQKFPINRLSLILEKEKRFKECLAEIQAYEKIIDKVGLHAGENEILGKRKERILKAIQKYPFDSKRIEATNVDNSEIKPPQDLTVLNEYQEDSDFQQFLNEESGFLFSMNEAQESTYIGMPVNLWIPKVKNPDEVYIYPRNANYSLGTVPVAYSDLIINHILMGMNYDARVVDRDDNSCKIKCRLISKEENALRKEEYKASLIKEMKKPYAPQKPIMLTFATNRKNAVKAGEKLGIEFEELESYGFYPKLYFPWHIKFLNKAGKTIGVFANDRSIIQRILKAHYNSYLFDIEVLEIANERNYAWKGYLTKLVIKTFKIKNE